jgi:hypothetical protein
MKDPTDLHFETGEFESWCAEDGKEWPCKTIRKWRKSTAHRLATLEEQVQRLGLSNAGLRKEGSAMRRQLHELDMIVNNGVVLALKDLIRPPASLTMTRTVDYIDHTPIGSSHKIRTVGMAEFNVEYKSTDGSIWKNKELVERRTPTWL